MTQTVLNKWSDFRVELDRRAAQIADLRALNAELVKTLEWYADESNYQTGQDWPDILIDNGAGARRAVAKAHEK